MSADLILPPQQQWRVREPLTTERYKFIQRLRDFDEHLYIVQGLDAKYLLYRHDPMHMSEPALVMIVQEDDGSWRDLDERVFIDLHRGDLRAKGHSYAEIQERKARIEAERRREWDELLEASKADLRTAAVLDGEAMRNFFPMHRPQRDRGGSRMERT